MVFGSFVGLVVRAAHALVDTGAQSGVIGIHYFRLWVGLLAKHYGLQPLFFPVPENQSAGGVGGRATIVAIAKMPIGIAGVPGLMEWAVMEDVSEEDATPPLLPNVYFKQTDAIIEPRQRVMTLRGCGGAKANLIDLPSEHQTTSIMDFGGEPWEMPKECLKKYVKEYGENPFIFGTRKGYQPSDSRLDVAALAAVSYTHLTLPSKRIV